MGKRAATTSKKSQPVKTRLPPLGKGPIKRTPRHEFDHRDNTENIYDVECIIAERSVKVNGLTVEEWLIRWKGYSDSHDTWEPIENLAGLEDDIAHYRNAKSEQQPLKLGKRRRRTPFDDNAPVAVAANPGESVPGSSAAATSNNTEEEEDCVEEDESDDAILRPAMRGRRTAKVISVYSIMLYVTVLSFDPSPYFMYGPFTSHRHHSYLAAVTTQFTLNAAFACSLLGYPTLPVVILNALDSKSANSDVLLCHQVQVGIDCLDNYD